MNYMRVVFILPVPKMHELLCLKQHYHDYMEELQNFCLVATTKAAQPIQSSLVNNNINKPLNAIKKNVSVKEDLKPNSMNGR